MQIQRDLSRVIIHRDKNTVKNDFHDMEIVKHKLIHTPLNIKNKILKKFFKWTIFISYPLYFR